MGISLINQHKDKRGLTLPEKSYFVIVLTSLRWGRYKPQYFVLELNLKSSSRGHKLLQKARRLGGRAGCNLSSLEVGSSTHVNIDSRLAQSPKRRAKKPYQTQSKNIRRHIKSRALAITSSQLTSPDRMRPQTYFYMCLSWVEISTCYI